MLSSDLSEYERIRLENIRRNADFLTSLGLETVISQAQASAAAAARTQQSKEVKASSKKRKINQEDGNSAIERMPRRTSLRLQSLQDTSSIKLEAELHGKEPEAKREEEDKKIDYEAMPFDSEQLDDYEFQVYTHLKAWRLQRCRELDIEPYKICQNRTLAELIRLRRKNPSWAQKADESAPGSGKQEKDLLECWGIGPSKAKADGYGPEMIAIIDDNSELLQLLDESRKL
jgi:superfamily II DNA helicase RecQ